MNGYMNYGAMGESVSWESKYRPQSLEETVLPARIKDRLRFFRDRQSAPHFIFYGTPGSGKTTTARCFNSDDTTHINATKTDKHYFKSLEWASLCSAKSLWGKRKVILLDEADAFTVEAQKALRGDFEHYVTNCHFIMTVNDLGRIMDPLQSRCKLISFNFHNDELKLELMPLIERRIRWICEQEDVTLPEALIHTAMTRHYPDIRAILKELYFEAIPASLPS